MDKRVSSTIKSGERIKPPHDVPRKAAIKEGRSPIPVESISDMIVSMTLDGNLRYVSPASLSLLGLTPAQVLGRCLYDLTHTADGDLVRRVIAQSAEGGGLSSCEFRLRHANGNILWVEMRSQCMHDDGNTEVVAVIRDISARHRQEMLNEELRHNLEEQVEIRNRQLEMTVKLLRKQVDAHKHDRDALELSERRYATLVENILTGIYIHDGTKLVFCNERFAQIFGFDRDNMESINTNELFAGDRSMETLLSDRGQEELVEGMTCDGKVIWFKVSRAPLTCNGQSLVIGNVIDITEQIVMNERLKASEQELHLLSSQLMAAQEIERKRIANELHDGLGQRLSAIKFSVENVWRAIDVEVYPDQSRRLTAIIDSMRSAIEEVRRVSMDLRPSILDDLGLIATVGWFCREFSLLFPEIGVHRSINAGEGDIPDEVKVVIFRIIQEAFHNITRHAQADQIELDLVSQNNTLNLMIRDNGRGISTIDRSPCAKGLGLKSMRERAELSHGEFRIESVPGRGTTISVLWPRNDQSGT